VHYEQELCTVDGVDGRETAARKHTQLQYCRDCRVLGSFCTTSTYLCKELWQCSLDGY